MHHLMSAWVLLQGLGNHATLGKQQLVLQPLLARARTTGTDRVSSCLDLVFSAPAPGFGGTLGGGICEALVHQAKPFLP